MKNNHLLNLESKSLELIRNSFIENRSISTTSFGITSVVLIDLIAKTNLDIPTIFIDTGFHFGETIDYYKTIVSQYPKMCIKSISSTTETNNFIKENGQDIYKENPDFCCNVNKIFPLDNYIDAENVSVWYAAIRKSQSVFRNSLNEKVKMKNDLMKVHPLLYWSEGDVFDYIKTNSLPNHPLSKQGYESVGCYPCTKVGHGRAGRWNNSTKTECGLHFNQTGN
jgi:phosphoadenosine phosphosulfate reductase